MDKSEYTWVEKYRRHKISECILPKSLKSELQSFVDNGDFPNLLLVGTPGVGKTSTALALAEELGYDVMFINGSRERNIDTVRTKIVNYASTTTFDGSPKMIIIDEADGLNAESAQPALKATIEEFPRVKFVMTANHEGKIIEPIRSSRLVTIRFTVKSKTDKTEMTADAVQAFSRILKAEGIPYDLNVVLKFVQSKFPDFRAILNHLHYYAKSTGKIDTGILVTLDSDFKPLIDSMVERDFGKAQQWIHDNDHLEPHVIHRKLYDGLRDFLEPSSVPAAVVLIGENAQWVSIVVDQRIHLTQLIVKMMSDLEFKAK
jgi:DNA polymerase III delta prime subunit